MKATFEVWLARCVTAAAYDTFGYPEDFAAVRISESLGKNWNQDINCFEHKVLVAVLKRR